jgi:hypothetical protein
MNKQLPIPPIPKNGNGWSKIIIWVLTTIASVGVAYGVLTTKIEGIEKELITYKTDHDLIITLIVKVDNIQGTLNEIKHKIDKL